MTGYGLLHEIVSARPAGGLRLHLRFDDGVEGEVDLREVIGEFKGLLAPLMDPAYVAQVRVEPGQGTVSWPNGVDLDEVVLYCAVRGVPVPSYDEKPQRSTKTAPADASGRRAAARTSKGRRHQAGA